MKLPAPATAPSTEFVNAKGSTVPKEFAIAARKNPEAVSSMAESPSELKDLTNEALVRNYAILIDRSGSMSSPDGMFGTRWNSAQKAVTEIVDTVFKYDTDGRVPLYLFDDQVEFVGECTDSSQVKGVFESYRPRGTTDLAKCLDVAMKKYAGKHRQNCFTVPGSTFIVILDGSTDDNDAVKTVLNHYADPANGHIENHIDVGISLIQIGDDDEATRFLKELDDGSPGYPDICDTLFDNELFKSGGVEKMLRDALVD